MKAVFWVTDQDMTHIKNGMTVTIEKNGKSVFRRISEISWLRTKQGKAFKVEAEFPNKKPRIICGNDNGRINSIL
jgi:Fe-S cluster assembly iron-binding protein IscA